MESNVVVGPSLYVWGHAHRHGGQANDTALGVDGEEEAGGGKHGSYSQFRWFTVLIRSSQGFSGSQHLASAQHLASKFKRLRRASLVLVHLDSQQHLYLVSSHISIPAVFVIAHFKDTQLAAS